MGVEGTSLVRIANRRVQNPRRHRLLSAGGDRKVRSMWLARGAATLRRSRRSVVWQVRRGASGAGGAKDHQEGRADGFLCLVRRVNGSTTAHVDNKNIDGPWRGEARCVGPKAKDADMWSSRWDMLNRIHQEGMELEVRRVKAHRTKEEEKKITRLERFIMEGNEKADDFAKEGVVDGGNMVQVRASSVQQRRREVYELKRRQKENWESVERKVEADKRRAEWCATSNKNRCMRCGKNSRNMRMPGRCGGPLWMKKAQRGRNGGEQRHTDGHCLMRKSGSRRRDHGVVQELFRTGQNQDGPEAHEQMSAGGKKAQRSGARCFGESCCWRKARCQPRRRRIGSRRGKRCKSPERSTRG